MVYLLIYTSGFLISTSSNILSRASIMSFSRFWSKMAKRCCLIAFFSIYSK